MSEVFYTNPPTECDICHEPIKDEFVDGATSYGPWACMCPKCFKHDGRGLGVGLGQKYVRSDNQFKKVA